MNSQAQNRGFSRRNLLVTAGSLLALAAAGIPARVLAAQAAMVAIENFSPAGKSLGVVREAKVVKSEADWQKMLKPEEFEVTRHAGTEQSFTGSTWNNHADGLYRCVCCDTALYGCKHEIQIRHRLAELLATDLQTQRRADVGQQPVYGTHRDFLRPLRRPSRPRFR